LLLNCSQLGIPICSIAFVGKRFDLGKHFNAFYLSQLTGYWSCIAIRFRPIIFKRSLCDTDIQLPAANQVTQAVFEPILGLSIPYRLKFTPWLRPQVAVIIGAPAPQWDLVINFEIRVGANRQAVFNHDPVPMFLSRIFISAVSVVPTAPGVTIGSGMTATCCASAAEANSVTVIVNSLFI
jgi:hypothetical protein